MTKDIVAPLSRVTICAALALAVVVGVIHHLSGDVRWK
jgi:negative regulator of sigma E activity